MDEGPRHRGGWQPSHDSAAVRDTDRRSDHVSSDNHRDKPSAKRLQESPPDATKERSAADEEPKAAEERRRWWETQGLCERRMAELAHQARVREDKEKRRLEMEQYNTEYIRKVRAIIDGANQDGRGGRDESSAGGRPGA